MSIKLSFSAPSDRTLIIVVLGVAMLVVVLVLTGMITAIRSFPPSTREQNIERGAGMKQYYSCEEILAEKSLSWVRSCIDLSAKVNRSQPIEIEACWSKSIPLEMKYNLEGRNPYPELTLILSRNDSIEANQGSFDLASLSSYYPRTVTLKPGDIERTSWTIAIPCDFPYRDVMISPRPTVTYGNKIFQDYTREGLVICCVGGNEVRVSVKHLPIFDRWLECGGSWYDGKQVGSEICKENLIELSSKFTRKFNSSAVRMNGGGKAYALQDSIFQLNVKAGQKVRIRVNATPPVNIEVGSEKFPDYSYRADYVSKQITSLEREFTVENQGYFRVSFYVRPPDTITTVTFEFERLP